MLSDLPGGQIGFLIVVNIFVFFLAFFLDFFEIAFIILPLLAPVADKMGIDLIWFGVLLCVNMQTSFMHPPFGFALFYLRGIADTLYKNGALPAQGRIEGHLPGRDPVGDPAAAAGGDRDLRAADGDGVPGQGEGGRPRQGPDPDDRARRAQTTTSRPSTRCSRTLPRRRARRDEAGRALGVRRAAPACRAADARLGAGRPVFRGRHAAAAHGRWCWPWPCWPGATGPSAAARPGAQSVRCLR